MKSLSIVFLFLVLLWRPINAQVINKNSILNSVPRNSVYIEFLGNGYYYSFNYDRIIPMKASLASYIRFGIMKPPIDHAGDEWTFVMLGEIGTLFGRTKHFVESGIGFTNFFGTNDKGQYIAFRLGYRYIGAKGLIIRLAPIYIDRITRFGFVNKIDKRIWAGLSIGFSF